MGKKKIELGTPREKCVTRVAGERKQGQYGNRGSKKVEQKKHKAEKYGADFFRCIIPVAKLQPYTGNAITTS